MDKDFTLRGVDGALYYQELGGRNIKVVKPDGKTFWIPLRDMKDLLRIIELEGIILSSETEKSGLRNAWKYDN